MFMQVASSRADVENGANGDNRRNSLHFTSPRTASECDPHWLDRRISGFGGFGRIALRDCSQKLLRPFILQWTVFRDTRTFLAALSRMSTGLHTAEDHGRNAYFFRAEGHAWPDSGQHLDSPLPANLRHHYGRRRSRQPRTNERMPVVGAAAASDIE